MGDNGDAGLTPEQIAENARVELEKERTARLELERKLSEQGEQLSQITSALDGYRRGEAIVPSNPQDGEEELPDPIEKPKEFRDALAEREKRRDSKLLNQFQAMQQARENAVRTRQMFFKLNPDLLDFEELVDIATGRYMHVHGNDSLLQSNPERFQEIAFKAISEDVRERVNKMFGGKRKTAPFFEPGGGSGPEKGGREKGDDEQPAYGTEAEMHKAELDEYVKDKSAKRNKR